MSFDYNVFTKDELVHFLKNNDKNYKHIALPYKVMLEDKMNRIMKEMEENVATGEFLVRQMKKYPDDTTFRIEYMQNHKRWEKLNKEHDKVCNMLFKGDKDGSNS